MSSDGSGRFSLGWVAYAALGALVAALVIFFGGGYGGRAVAAQFTELPRGLAFSSEGVVHFHALGSGEYFFAGGGSVSFVGRDGVVAWEYTTTLSGAAGSYSVGDMLLVYEPLGVQLYVFSPEGLLHSQNLSGDVMRVGLGPSGAAGVILRTQAGYETHLFDESGASTVNVIHSDPGVFPTAVAISDDGELAALALMDAGGVGLRSVIELYRNEIGGGISGRLQYDDDEAIALLLFMDDASLVAFSDRAVHSFNLEEDTRDSMPLVNRVSMLNRMGTNGFVIAFGEGMPGAEAERAGTVVGFNSALNELLRFQTDKNITHLFASQSGVVVGAGRSIYGLAPGGRLLWSFDATQDFSHALMLENRDTILFVTRAEARVLRQGSRFWG